MSAAALDLMVFVDVICPWCYVGKRRLEKALAMMDTAVPVRVSWCPFELNPDMPKGGMERALYRMRKFGSLERSKELDAQLTALGVQEGLGFRYDLMLRTPNTFDAHRLIWLAGQSGAQDALVEGLMRAYFTQGRDIGDADTLADIAEETGMDRAGIIKFIDGEEGASEIRVYEHAAAQAGITGVPAFIANRRPLLMGAQPPEIIASALREAMEPVPAG